VRRRSLLVFLFFEKIFESFKMLHLKKFYQNHKQNAKFEESNFENDGHEGGKGFLRKNSGKNNNTQSEV
jgi:hypothetical protein